jgi:RNA polymerase sigma factor (sigma-70 family)
MTTGGTPTISLSDLSITDVLSSAGDGNQAAWEEVIRRYGRLVSAVVRGYGLQEADRRDAEQGTWLQLVQHHRAVRDPERLGAWLSTTARRECLRVLRRASHIADLDEVDAMPDPRSDVEQQVLDADEVSRVWAVVAAFPPRRQAVARELLADDRKPYADIARSTGIPVGSLGPTRARVLAQLRRVLETADDALEGTDAAVQRRFIAV